MATHVNDITWLDRNEAAGLSNSVWVLEKRRYGSFQPQELSELYSNGFWMCFLMLQVSQNLIIWALLQRR
jgi:hypothetical protein